MFKGVIFDFNGTLYFDSDINYRAWNIVIDEITEGQYDFEELYLPNKSIPNARFLEKVLNLCNKPADKEQLDKWSHHKEEIYQDIGIKENRTVLAPGAEELFDYLKTNNIPVNIATSSIAFNVDFYFNHFPLSKWFDKKLIAFDNGCIKDKVEMYKNAAREIGCDIKDCLVFEDSAKSLDEAVEAGCQKVVYVDSANGPIERESIIQTIKDFRDFNYSLLELEI